MALLRPTHIMKAAICSVDYLLTMTAYTLQQGQRRRDSHSGSAHSCGAECAEHNSQERHPE